MLRLLALFLLTLCLAGCETTAGDAASGVRLHLSQHQLYIITSQHLMPGDFGRLLPLTPAQQQQVKAQLGKDIPSVWIINDPPVGRTAQYGYNLALRDKAESMVVLSSYALSPAEAARKKAATPAFAPDASDATMPDAAPEELNVPDEPPFSIKPLPE